MEPRDGFPAMSLHDKFSCMCHSIAIGNQMYSFIHMQGLELHNDGIMEITSQCMVKMPIVMESRHFRLK